MTKKKPMTIETWADTHVRDVDELADTADLLEQNDLETLGAVWEFLDHGGSLEKFDGAAPLDHETVKVWFDAFFDANPTWKPEKQPSAEQAAQAQMEAFHREDLAERLHKIGELGIAWAKSSAALERAKRNEKDAKALLESHSEEYAELEANGPQPIPQPDPQKLLPFQDDSAPAELVEDNSREDLITTEQAGVPQAIRDKLETNQHPDGTPFPIRTYGDVNRWRTEYELTDIEGIGPGKAQKVQDCFDAWFQQNPTPVAKPTKVKLRQDLPGYDVPDVGGIKGAILPITGWDGEDPVVVLAGDEITLDPEDFELVA